MNVLQVITAAGLSVRTDAQCRILVKPGARLTEGLRRLIDSNRAELLAELAQAHELSVALVAAINLCCDLRGDDDINRAGLIVDCKALHMAGQIEMRDHFNEQAALWLRANGRTT